MESAIYVVATPIGNLSDITHRAIDVLKGVDLVAAEDTRQTRKLLDHYQIDARLVAVHEHNERDRAQSLVEKVREGGSLAIVSDAGTPLISDPGYHIVRCARELGCRVIPVPGACAVTAALSASGLSCASFAFEGFLPAKQKARKDLLESYEKSVKTVCFYESPHRILHALEAMLELYPEREIVLARELTKTFETFLCGSVRDVYQRLVSDDNQRKGEFVVLISPAQKKALANDVIPEELNALVSRLSVDLPPKKVAAIIADVYGVNKKLIYNHIIGLPNP